VRTAGEPVLARSLIREASGFAARQLGEPASARVSLAGSAVLPADAFFAAHRSFIRVASFSRASGLRCRFFFFFCFGADARAGFALLGVLFFGGFAFLLERLDLFVSFPRNFTSFLVNLAMLASRR